ncbi:MAG: hemerythrin domain-containing protein [Thermanaerothrix sp.]|uniref:hemerythrin domain-containing protein n=1 Tax=Thermanaerothrix sp. TaxID=2972675 RepID=UPI003C7E7D06
MEATHLLREEHEVITRVINALEEAARVVERGGDISPQFFLDAAQFVRGFADGCHHKKEENVFFPALVAHGMAIEGGPIGVMLAEHDQGRRTIRALVAAAERWAQGDLSARTEVAQQARAYAALLRQHIEKENHVLFPLAEDILPPETQVHLVERFDHLEHEETGAGIHEKYLALAERLCAAVSQG